MMPRIMYVYCIGTYVQYVTYYTKYAITHTLYQGPRYYFALKSSKSQNSGFWALKVPMYQYLNMHALKFSSLKISMA